MKNDDGRKEKRIGLSSEVKKGLKSNLVIIPKKDIPKNGKDWACPHVIAQLKQLLALAEQGEIKNVFAICELRTEDPMFVQAGKHNALIILGLLDWAKARWRDTQIYDYEEDQELDTS